MLIGFIGQGWIGKNYADNFEKRGLDVVRYALEPPYNENEKKIAEADIVFIAVPTPTTPEGFDDSIVRKVIKLVGKGKTAVIKSTIVPGTTESIQAENPDIFVMHSPEFLREAHVVYDTAHPARNIVGIPVQNEEYKKRAQAVLDVVPHAVFRSICSSKEAELIKYGGNVFLYLKVVYANLIHDLSTSLDCDPQVVLDAMAADPRIGVSHMKPVHASGHVGEDKKGRGAGGHCFIKDYAAFRELYEKSTADAIGTQALRGFEEKNNDLLRKSNKDIDLLDDVYGAKGKNIE